MKLVTASLLTAHKQGGKAMQTHIAFILDMSGSMAAVESATREGAVGYFRILKTDTPDARVNLTIFDTVVEHWITDQAASEMKVKTTLAKWQPRGGTALYDAVGETVKALAEKVGKDDKAIVTVMTDGQENSSVKWDRKKLNKLVNRLTKQGNWTFVYMGANVDAWDESGKLGFAKGNTMAYSSSPGSTRAAMHSHTHATVALAHSGLTSTSGIYKDADLDQDVRDEDDK